MLRKTIIFFFICTMLCSCAISKEDISDTSDQPNAVSDSAAVISGSAIKESNVASNSAVVVSGGAVVNKSDNAVIVTESKAGKWKKKTKHL